MGLAKERRVCKYMERGACAILCADALRSTMALAHDQPKDAAELAAMVTCRGHQVQTKETWKDE
jgi:hypothetical protein